MVAQPDSKGERAGGMLATVTDAALARPAAAAAVFTLIHAALWVIYFDAARVNLDRDVMEMVALGREWMPALPKLPPLPGWVAAAVDSVAAGRQWPFAVLSQVFVAVTFWTVWTLSAELVGRTRALISVAVLTGIAVYGYHSGFNHDTAQLPFWALIALSLYRAVTRDKLLHWVLLGIWVALAVLSKYAVVALVAPLAALMLIHPQGRAALRTPGPYLAIACTSVLLAPHVMWLVAHDFLAPIRYAVSKTGHSPTLADHVLRPATFLIYQVLFTAPALLAIAVLRGRHDRVAPLGPATSFQRWFVLAVGLGPVAAMLLLSALSGWTLPHSWGLPMFDFLGLFAVMFAAPRLDERSIRRFGAVVAAVLIGSPLATGVVELAVDPLLEDYYTYQFPGRALARRVEAGWREATAGAPLRFVVGDLLLTANVAFHAADRPRIYLDADPAASPWIDEAQLRRDGAVLLWNERRNPAPPSWVGRFEGLRLQPPIALPREALLPMRDEVTGWAILPPAGLAQDQSRSSGRAR